MRSEYSWVPPHSGTMVTSPHQIGVSFTEHRHLVYELGGHAARLDVAVGSVFATGRERVTWDDVADNTECVEIYPDLDLVRAAAPRVRQIEIEPVCAGRDPVILGIAAVLKRAHVHGTPLSELHASTLAHRLAMRLATSYCGALPATTAAPGKLDDAQLGRVIDVVEGRLGEAITLHDLATAARLSPFHFARAFKASTGMSPHEFVTMRRIERAKAMLLGTLRSSAEIAHTVGFSNLSHYRRIFRRYTGFAPSDLRG